MEKKDSIRPATPDSLISDPRDLGLENWDTRDFVLPQLRIRQPTSDVDNVAEGQFYDVLTHEAYDTVHVVFLKSSWGRMYFDRDQGVLLCRSVDRIHPSPSVENPPSSLCATCQYSFWEDDRPPKCREVLNNILLVSPEKEFKIENASPYLMTIAGASLKPMRLFVSGLAAKRKPIYSVVTRMSLEKKSGAVGKYYVGKRGEEKGRKQTDR